MKKNEIKTIEMVRHIRESNFEKLKGKSAFERIQFYREKAIKLYKKLEGLSEEQTVKC